MTYLWRVFNAWSQLLNAIIGGLNAILTTIGEPLCTASVDVRPLSEKLAAQGREIAFDGTAFVVTALPQPEPEESPEAEP